MSLREWIGAFLMGIGAGIGIVGGTLIWAMNIDGTNGRIILDHWWFYLPCFAAMFVGAILYGDRRYRR